jgi:hypothetical protein
VAASPPDDWSDGKLAWGAEGEHLVAKRLMRDGAAISPLYQYQNHDRAPLLVWEGAGKEMAAVLPDLTVFGRGRVFFAEVKRKGRWVDYPPAMRGLETGFGRRLYYEYLAVERQAETPVWVFWVHERGAPTGVFVARLDSLRSGKVDCLRCRGTGGPPTARCRQCNGSGSHAASRDWDGKNERTGRPVIDESGKPTGPMILFPLRALTRRWSLADIGLAPSVAPSVPAQAPVDDERPQLDFADYLGDGKTIH